MLLARLLVATALCLGSLTVPGQAQEPVRVGSKIDAEGALLGTMILKTLAADGIQTVDRLRLGPTSIVRRALLAGEIDIYPEYTGNGALFYGLESDPAWRDTAAGYARIKALDKARHDLVWLPPAPADNSWVIAVPRDLARAHHLASMADFAAWARAGGRIKLAASAEFVESPAALPAFEKVYGFHLAPSQLVVLAGGDTSVTIRAAAEHISGVDAAMAYGTDGALAALRLVALADPRRAQVVYAPAAVLRGAVLAHYPEIATSLARVFRSLDQSTLRHLNARIVVEGEAADVVATDYLRAIGVLR